MVSYAVAVDDDIPIFSYYTDLEFVKDLKLIGEADWLIGFNIKFDLHWARRYNILPKDGVRVWDCQIAEFILRGQQGSYPSLNEALERFELGSKDDKIAEYWALGIETTDIPTDELKFYNNLDVELTNKLYHEQYKVMTDKQKRLCIVMGLDLLILEEMEWNGIKLDVEKCNQKAIETEEKLKEISDELNALSGGLVQNWDSGHQLSCYLYGGAYESKVVDHIEKCTYKSGPKKGTEYERNVWRVDTVECFGLFVPLTGSETKLVSKAFGKEFPIYATGEDVLKQLKAPTKRHKRIIELLLSRAEQAKLLDTYFGALPKLLQEMEWGDYLHGQLNQVVARTGRLSSSAPNMQNFSGPVDELLMSRFC